MTILRELKPSSEILVFKAGNFTSSDMEDTYYDRPNCGFAWWSDLFHTLIVKI